MMLRLSKQEPSGFSPPRAIGRRSRVLATGRISDVGQPVTPGGFSAWRSRPAFFVVRRTRAGSDTNSPRGGDSITVAKAPEVRVNDRIRVPQVRVIGDDGSQIGVLATREALQLAQSKSLDLVEVSPTARPPVCRIMDYGKFKYEQNRRARKAKKKQHQMQLKEVKMRPKIDDHDYDFKMNHARDFLNGRDKVKFTITFRGREMAHTEIGHELMKRILAELVDVAIVESPPRQEGRSINAVVMPKAQKVAAAAVKADSKVPDGANSAGPNAPDPT
jgi:translation initiation factor IF-3